MGGMTSRSARYRRFPAAPRVPGTAPSSHAPLLALPVVVLSATVAAFALYACSLFGSLADVTVRLPPVPAGLDGVYSGFSLVYPDETGRFVTEAGIPAGTEVSLSLEKGRPVPVIAVPEGPGFLPAAGGVWPAEAAPKSAEGTPAGAAWDAGWGAADALSLSWENGAAAEILRRLCSADFPVEAVNVERLLVEIVERSEGDPWRIDVGAVCEAFWYDSMRADKIKPSAAHTLALPAQPGTWIAGNPLAPVRALEAVDGFLTITVGEGCASFYRAAADAGGFTADGDGVGGVVERLDICCDETGWFAVNPVTGYGGSGTW